MRVPKNLVTGLFLGLLIVCVWVLFNATPARASGETCSNGSPAPCSEDLQINGCTACHSIRVTGGNRNGTSRVITGSAGSTRHIDDPNTADWTSIVSAMQSKGALATSATAGYLNTNYCPACTGPILGSPVQSAVTDSSATVTWGTSYTGFEDELTTTVLFYGETESDVLACTNLAGCPGVSVIQNSTPVAHHVVSLTGLSPFTFYYMVNQATSGSHGTTRSTYAASFRTKPFTGGGGVIIPKLYVYNFYDDSEIGSIDYGIYSDIFVIDPATNNLLQTLPAGAASGPGEMASNPDGTAVYFMADSNLSVIQTEDDTFSPALLGAGGTSNHLAVSRDGDRLYLAYLDSGDSKVKIKVYNTTDSLNPTLVTTITNAAFNSCTYPLGSVVHPNGAHLFMACHGTTDRFFMIDTATYVPTQTATFTTDANDSTVNAMAVLPGGLKVYVVRVGTPSTVQIFNGVTGASSGSVTLPASAFPRSAVTSLEGSLLFVQDGFLGVHVIDTAGQTLLETMDQSTSQGFDIAINASGSRVYSTGSVFTQSIFYNDTDTYDNIGSISLACALNCYEYLYQLTISPGHNAPPVPDVVMTDVTPNAASVAAGYTLSVTDTVDNQGTGSTESSFDIGYHLSTNTTYGDGDDIPIATTRVVGPLAEGVDDMATTDLLIPSVTAPGTYHVCAIADSTGALAETNVDNNTRCSTATVTIARPDLIMTAVTPNGGSAAAGGTLSVTDTVKNQGTAPNGASFTVGYSLSPDSVYGNGDDVVITTTRVVGPLAPNASNTATTNLFIPLSTPPGTYHVCATADSGNTVNESDETNNSRCSTAMVGPAIADLIMSTVSTTATGVAPGKSVSVSNKAKNQGNLSAGNFTIAFHLSTNVVYGDGDDIAFTATRTITSLGIGASTTSASTSLVVPAATPLGTYYICAKADSNNTVPEGDETNNTLCTAGTIQVSGPDLIMTVVTPNDTTVSSTAKLSVTNSAKNQGAVLATSFTVGYSLSLNTTYGDADDVVIATTRTISSLAGGATNTATTTLTIPNTTTPGNYHVCAKADSAGAVTELDETNNTLCSAATVSVPQPDLVMTAASTTATILTPGGAFTLSNTAKNQGDFPAGSSVVGFHLSTNTIYGDGDDVEIAATRTIASLAAGASSVATTSLTIPASTPFGTYRVCAMADGGNTVSELVETNNSLCTGTTIQVNGPDLVMTAVTPTASTVNPGSTLSVTNSAKNQGLLSAASSKVGYRLSLNTTYGDGDDVVITTTRTITSLAAGATSTATTSLTIPATTTPGDYYVCAMADSLMQLGELDETNNALCSAATVSVPQSDLVMTAVSTTATTLAAGTIFTLSNTVKNQGGTPVGSFTIEFHLSTNGMYGDGDDVAITQIRSLASLAAGASSTATTTMSVPASTPFGAYRVCAMADSGNTMPESDETNNTLCTGTTIQVSGPDLVMTAVTPNAATVNQGKTLSVTNSAKNQGLLSAGASKVGYRLSLNTTYGDGDDVVIATTRTITSLAAGATSSATTSLAIPSTTPPGDYYVCAMADSLLQVAELDEANNVLCSAGTVSVPPPDLIMSAVSTTASTVAVGASFTLSNTAKNQGGSSAGSFMIGYHLSADTTYGGGDDVAITETRSVSSLAIGATSAATTTLTVPLSTTTGTYHVCANADDADEVGEGADEGNNSKCTTSTISVP
jgi:subtilase family serine protease